MEKGHVTLFLTITRSNLNDKENISEHIDHNYQGIIQAAFKIDNHFWAHQN